MFEFLHSILQLKELIWAMLGLGMGLTLLVSLIKLHFSETYSKFSLLSLFCNPDGSINSSKSRMTLAFIVTSYILIWITMKITTVTSDYVLLFTSYGSFWIIDRIHARSKTPLPGLEGPKDESEVSKNN